jgi:hypothetical protein
MGGFDDYELARSNAHGAMATFFFVFLVSVVYLIGEALASTPEGITRSSRNGSDYEGLSHHSGPGMGYAMNLDLPASVQVGVYS